jgi:2TM family of unknown function (DUF5676)
MTTINSNKLGMALGATGVILYLGCIFLMLLVGQSGTTWFFNTVFHGLDVTTISRMNVPAWQAIAGILLTFAMGWITGFLTGSIYNRIDK